MTLRGCSIYDLDWMQYVLPLRGCSMYDLEWRQYVYHFESYVDI